MDYTIDLMCLISALLTRYARGLTLVATAFLPWWAPRAPPLYRPRFGHLGAWDCRPQSGISDLPFPLLDLSARLSLLFDPTFTHSLWPESWESGPITLFSFEQGITYVSVDKVSLVLIIGTPLSIFPYQVEFVCTLPYSLYAGTGVFSFPRIPSHHLPTTVFSAVLGFAVCVET